MFLEFFGSIAIAPIDWTGCSSNTGRKVVPKSSDFQTPPLAAPTKMVVLPLGSWLAAIADTRPLIVAEPMFRAPRPEMVVEVKDGWSAAAVRLARVNEMARINGIVRIM